MSVVLVIAHVCISGYYWLTKRQFAVTLEDRKHPKGKKTIFVLQSTGTIPSPTFVTFCQGLIREYHVVQSTGTIQVPLLSHFGHGLTAKGWVGVYCLHVNNEPTGMQGFRSKMGWGGLVLCSVRLLRYWQCSSKIKHYFQRLDDPHCIINTYPCRRSSTQSFYTGC